MEKFGPEASIEIVVVGGAAINYTFSRASAYLADVAKECSLSTDWMNHNVMVTGSFTPAIAQYAKHYKTFKGVLKVFTADALTLICMKSVCCRPDSHVLWRVGYATSILESGSKSTQHYIYSNY